MELPYDPASGRSRATRRGRRSRGARTAARTAGRAWRSTRRAGSSTSRPDRPRPTSTAPTGSATTSTPTRCSRSTPIQESSSGTSSSCGTTSGIATRRRRPSLITIRRDGKTIDAVAQATKHGYVFVFDRATGTPIYPIEYRKVPPSHRSRRSRRRDAAVSDAACPLRAPGPDARDDHLANARGPRVGARRAGEVPQRGPLRAALGRPADGDLPGIRRRRRMGRTGVRSRYRHLLCQRQRPRVDRGTGAGGRGRHRARPLPAELRRLPPRRPAGRAAPDRVARRHRAAKNES